MKIINFFKKTLMIFIVVLMCLITYGYYSVPDVINALGEGEIEFSGIYTVDVKKTVSDDAQNPSIENDDYESSVMLFDKIPIKTANAIIGKRKYVVPSGEIIGLRMFSKGVMVITTDSVETTSGKVNPSEKSGIKSGDLIISVDGNEVKTTTDLSSIIENSSGKQLSIVYIRDEKEREAQFTPVLSIDGKFRAGWWIRDSAAGIGTMTYFEKDTGIFGGLGHGICDVDTSVLLPLYYGDIVEAKISGCYKGTKGKAGELCGILSSDIIGTIYDNGDKGVYGIINNIDKGKREIPVALKDEVQTGKAFVLCTTDSSGTQKYEIEIEKIDMNDSASRNLVIKITDKNLLAKTGGIVQGMSGSPIIQNDRLVGAVTHVLVNDPQKGYGIFIENMLEASKRNRG